VGAELDFDGPASGDNRGRKQQVRAKKQVFKGNQGVYLSLKRKYKRRNLSYTLDEISFNETSVKISKPLKVA
jgi:hypothetical protein